MTDSPVTDSPVQENPPADAVSGAPADSAPEAQPETTVPTPGQALPGAPQSAGAEAAAEAGSHDRAGEGRRRGGNVGGGESAATSDTATDEAEGEAEAEGSEDPLESEGEVAADYLEELLDIADLDGDIDTYVESGRAHVSIVTTSDTLVGRDGQVLEALQELARLAVVTSTGRRSRLMLDVAGHRERRRQELTSLADDAVAEARETKEPVRLAPMNPYERKIVHDVVAAAGLTSESEGEEPRRRVVVLP